MMFVGDIDDYLVIAFKKILEKGILHIFGLLQSVGLNFSVLIAMDIGRFCLCIVFKVTNDNTKNIIADIKGAHTILAGSGNA